MKSIALAVTVLALAAIGVAATASAGAQEVLAGRYVGATDQQRGIELRVDRKDGKLVVASFQSSLAVHCPPSGAVSSTFGARPDAVIGGDGRVEFKAGEGAVTVSLIVGGEAVVGRIDYAMGSCHSSSQLTAYLQPPDPIVQAGRYVGVSNRAPLEMTVVQKRGFFELTGFTATLEECGRKKLGLDLTPEAFIEADGKVEFKALGGHARIEATFHHKSHVQGQIFYSNGSCNTDQSFAGRLRPPS